MWEINEECGVCANRACCVFNYLWLGPCWNVLAIHGQYHTERGYPLMTIESVKNERFWMCHHYIYLGIHSSLKEYIKERVLLDKRCLIQMTSTRLWAQDRWVKCISENLWRTVIGPYVHWYIKKFPEVHNYRKLKLTWVITTIKRENTEDRVLFDYQVTSNRLWTQGFCGELWLDRSCIVASKVFLKFIFFENWSR